MAKFLIQIQTGPDDPTKAPLGCLIAATALKEGHTVSVFFAGDGVHLLSPEALPNVEGQGTGKLGDDMAAIAIGLAVSSGRLLTYWSEGAELGPRLLWGRLLVAVLLCFVGVKLLLFSAGTGG